MADTLLGEVEVPLAQVSVCPSLHLSIDPSSCWGFVIPVCVLCRRGGLSLSDHTDHPHTTHPQTIKQVTEEDFLDVWLPLRSPGAAASHSKHAHAHATDSGSAGGAAPQGEQGWRVRVQVLLSFLLMCAKETQQRASVEAALRAGRGRGESLGAGLGVSVSGDGVVGGPSGDLGYDDDGSGGEEEGGGEVIRATTMMEGL